MKRKDFEKRAEEWLDIQFLNKDRPIWDEVGSLADLVQGWMDREFLDLNLQIVDLEKSLKETIACDNESMQNMMKINADLREELLQPFCTEHRKHVSDGFCDECNGDRNLIQPKVKE